GLGSCLLKAGADVAFVARAGTVNALHERGLGRTGIFGDFHAAPGSFMAVESLEQLPAGGFDFVLVCVKSFDSAATAANLAAAGGRLGQAGPIVLCQNGWGNAQAFVRFFPTERIYNARVITGFARPAANEVAITVHADAIHVGSLFHPEALGRVEALCAAISAGGIGCQTTRDIGADLWAKMLYNCCLNPLGAVLGVPYGRLGQSAASRAVMDEIAAEVYAVMAAAGWRTHWADAAGFLAAFYAHQLPATAAHESSMLQDLRARRRTEIDALNAQVVALAGVHGVRVPFNRAMCELIRFKEQEYLGR
ncbi:MAG: 2-dehydropantoate 2-reductase, partial [Planctomycetota bacterium]|nr:2-dehydropantoate 2-reductase [Planctomycetota bacterium]